ncbi:putative serine incorporator/TMS membrane protein [Helianthus debilis subsp. tardiflorus]
MFVSTSGTTKLHQRKELWHSSWWSAKIVLLIILTVLPFFLPTQLILLYGYIAHFGAGVFLLIQLISMISFITWLNDRCLSEKYVERW